MSPLLACRVVVTTQEMAKVCAGSLYRPVWVGSSREKLQVNTDLGVIKGSLSLAQPFLSAQIQSQNPHA